jgi:RNA recognition motif-containing protein
MCGCGDRIVAKKIIADSCRYSCEIRDAWRVLLDSLSLSRHGESSSELVSVMILDPVFGNSLWKANSLSDSKKHHMSNKLFVGNLSFNATENDLNDAFAAFGTVTETNLMMDRETGRPRGFGFITMSSADEAQKAIEGMNGKDMDGRALTVNVAKPREERAPGGGGGGRREYGGSGGGRRY